MTAPFPFTQGMSRPTAESMSAPEAHSTGQGYSSPPSPRKEAGGTLSSLAPSLPWPFKPAHTNQEDEQPDVQVSDQQRRDSIHELARQMSHHSRRSQEQRHSLERQASQHNGLHPAREERGGEAEGSSSRTLTDGGLESGGEAEDQTRTDKEQRSVSAQVDELNMDDVFDPPQGSKLDPYSEVFDAELYTQALVRASRASAEGETARKAGIMFRDLGVFGYGSDADYQTTVGNVPLALIGQLRDLISNRKRKVQILRSMDGILESGEMLVVLGPPGSGCTTMLKTIAGETNGIYLDEASELNYRGISPKEMQTQFRGEAIYTAEVDVHFPILTVGDTLSFAAETRCPRTPPAGLSRKEYAKHMRDVIMSVFGISHTVNTVVGNEYIRGVSGGERKRVTIAEAALAGAPLQCWDNSTRGLDSANAIEFCKNLRLGSKYLNTTSIVAIYQSPQSAYDLFDKVSVLYQGRQIFFGRCDKAKQFFLDMGFDCPDQQTTPDFLTSLTSATERIPRKGFENQVPRTPDEFEQRWKASPEYKTLMAEIGQYNTTYPLQGTHFDEFLASRRQQQSKHLGKKSPFTLSYGEQIKLCLKRGFWRLRADPSLTFTQLFGNFGMALIISSVFYNLARTTDSFFQRGAALFFAVLLNAFGAALEILTLYAQRSIVEKHARYAFYRPSAEAWASMLVDMPYKILNAIIFNITFYFMVNLRREPGPFFFFLLIGFFATLTMSMIFRSIASLSRSFVAAMTPAAVIMVGLIIYTGFAIPVTYMRGWARWMNYIDPIAYAFESLMINEFAGVEYSCSQFIPSGFGPYLGVGATNQVCSAVGSVLGQNTVSGTAYIVENYAYSPAHRWRNFGILLGFMFFFLGVYIVATEYISEKRSKGEILVYPRGHVPRELKDGKPSDLEAASSGESSSRDPAEDHKGESVIQRQTSIFSWKDVVYDIKIKKQPRRILDHVDGWVKPGTLTALMGVSGAGKTTLLDVLATRVTMGVVTGEMLVDGQQRDQSFQRKTGYVQQQDLHLQTSTVREALLFSALLRQPKSVPRAEKEKYVDEVLKLLEMETYGDAVVGVPGTGLNVEQRKRLTIGVELVAKPELLLFLDEPTSGLDSQTSWNILQLLRKLTQHGQAILCTIHQPSALLFEHFDRLLFLAKGGKTVYFGEVGKGSHILIDYFERNGAHKCPSGENPAEWMLSAIGASPGSKSTTDWHQVWRDSEEYQGVQEELRRLKTEMRGGNAAGQVDAPTREKRLDTVPEDPEQGAVSGQQKESHHPVTDKADKHKKKEAYAEFAAPFSVQFAVVLKRVFQQYWRTPGYIYSKILMSIVVALYIGFSFFKADNTQQGLQNQLFAAFMSFILFSQLVQQVMPNFVTQRSLYEVRERPSKTYSWKVFILTNIVIEIPWSVLVATAFFFCWYYPIGFYRNGLEGSTNERGALVYLYMINFFVFTSTFATAIISGMEQAEAAGNIANLLFSMSLVFCGVLASPSQFPRFWIFMYRVSPFTYFVEGLLGTGAANTPVTCSDTEYLHFNPPNGKSCGDYMAQWIAATGGYLQNPTAMDECTFCAVSNTNAIFASFNISYTHRWRDYGITWAFIIFNVFAAIFLYWLARVPKKSGKEQEKESASTDVQPIEHEDDQRQAQMAAVEKSVSRQSGTRAKRTNSRLSQTST